MHPCDARSLEELIAAVSRGGRPDFLFFWGHTPRNPQVTDQSCLSNWFPAPFVVNATRYSTTEHYMMAEKARLFGDNETRDRILSAPSPAQAKKLGRLVRGFTDEKWNQKRFEIVVTGNLAKFAQNSAMGEFLSSLRKKVIVEASPMDRIWGIGMGRGNEAVENPRKWKGLNLLGFALMAVSAQLTDVPSANH